MAGFNETDRKRIIEIVENVFEDGSITNHFNRLDYKRRFLLPLLSEEGYDVDGIDTDGKLDAIDAKIEAKPTLSYEQWADIYMDAMESRIGVEGKSRDEVEAHINETIIYLFITNEYLNHDDLSIEVNEQPSEFEFRFPSKTFFAECVESQYSENEFKNYAEEEKEKLNRFIEDELREINFPEQDPSKVRYEIRSIQFRQGSLDAFSEMMYYHYTYDTDNFHLWRYVTSDALYHDLLDNAQFGIEILDNPEDFENEEDY